jgi:hypothetical protein
MFSIASLAPGKNKRKDLCETKTVKKGKKVLREPKPPNKTKNETYSISACKNFKVSWPGNPKSNRDPVQIKDWRVYTDIAGGKYRALKAGERVDKASSWKVMSPKDAWSKILQKMSGKA